MYNKCKGKRDGKQEVKRRIEREREREGVQEFCTFSLGYERREVTPTIRDFQCFDEIEELRGYFPSFHFVSRHSSVYISQCRTFT